MNDIRILDKTFREMIPAEMIEKRIKEIALQMNNDLKGREVVFIGILNGAFMFAADLLRNIEFSPRITFVKLASYVGTGSSGKVRELIGWNEDISNMTVVVVEDIVDTGQTLERIVDELNIRKVKEMRIATLFLKTDVYSKQIELDYVGFEIPNNFIIGFGLDYNGYGRNFRSVYTLVS